MAGCRPVENGKAVEARNLLDAAVTPGDCARLPRWSAPAPGTFISSRYTSGSQRIEILMTVLTADDYVFEHSQIFRLGQGTQVQMENRAKLFGVLNQKVGSGSSLERTFVYPESPEALYGLNAGEAREFAVAERIKDRGREVSTDHRFSIQVLGCGTLKWEGGVEPVKAFKADTASAGLDRDGNINAVGRDVITVYVAPRLGLPLLMVTEGGSREEVQTIRPPE
ncbi:MAG: hypothetical protein K2X07_08500 [Caulobacteraceae bacterium]|nr:hypothetical protein [Caulobacteraceae bacterium]